MAEVIAVCASVLIFLGVLAPAMYWFIKRQMQRSYFPQSPKSYVDMWEETSINEYPVHKPGLLPPPEGKK